LLGGLISSLESEGIGCGKFSAEERALAVLYLSKGGFCRRCHLSHSLKECGD
jgi:hypothetical protein